MLGFYLFLIRPTLLLGLFNFDASVSVNQRTVTAANESNDLRSEMNDNQQRDHDDNRSPLRRLRQQDRHRTEENANRVNREYSRAVRQTHVQ